MTDKTIRETIFGGRDGAGLMPQNCFARNFLVTGPLGENGPVLMAEYLGNRCLQWILSLARGPHEMPQMSKPLIKPVGNYHFLSKGNPTWIPGMPNHLIDPVENEHFV